MTAAPAHSPGAKLSTLVARPWVAVLAGTILPLIGLLPWWISDARSVPSLSGSSPVLLIPLGDDVALLLTSLLVTGSAFAALVLRRLAGTHRSTTAFWAASGHALALTFLVVQSGLALGTAVDGGPQQSYHHALVVWSVGCAVLALAVLVLMIRMSRPGAALLLSLAAPAIGTWAKLWVPGAQPWSTEASLLLRWLPALLVGAALIWCGLRSWPARGIWLAALGGLWVLPAADMTLQYLVGYPRADSPDEWLLAGFDLFTIAVSPASAGPSVLLALLVAAAGTAVLWIVTRNRSRVPVP